MYTPLFFAKNLSINTLSQGSAMRNIMDLCMEDSDNVLSFLRFSSEFLHPDYNGAFSKLNRFLLAHRKEIYPMMFGSSEAAEAIMEDREQDHDAAGDILLPYLIVNRWSPSKQVYKFDAEMEFALSDTEETHIPVRILDRLPYQTFYIEFAEDGIFSSHFHGAFITFAKRGAGYDMFILRVMEDGRSMTGGSSFVPEDGHDGTFVISSDTDYGHSSDGSHIDWKESATFLINAVLYLCAQNAEIRESAETKTTYRPTAKVKNKYSEVRKYECGYVFGAKIRQSLQKIEDCDVYKVSKTKRHRYAVRPHMRKAHWHHYWTGKGRTELVVRWIAPTMVGKGERPATIHEVEAHYD